MFPFLFRSFFQKGAEAFKVKAATYRESPRGNPQLGAKKTIKPNPYYNFGPECDKEPRPSSSTHAKDSTAEFDNESRPSNSAYAKDSTAECDKEPRQSSSSYAYVNPQNYPYRFHYLEEKDCASSSKD